MVRSKPILIGAGIAAAVWGAAYMLRLNRLSNELETVTKVSIYKIDLSGIQLKVQVTLKNPSGGSVNLKYPFVKLVYDTTTIASSQVKDVDVTIPKFNELKLEPIMINLGFITLATKVPGLLKEYRSTGKLTFMTRIITTINGSIPFSKDEAITLGSGKQA
jgi:hypothetical protein